MTTRPHHLENHCPAPSSSAPASGSKRNFPRVACKRKATVRVPQKPSPLAPWPCGPVALWPCGPLALWPFDPVALWPFGASLPWHQIDT